MAEEKEESALEPFGVRGTKEEPKEVAADDVLNAVAEGRDIDIQYDAIVGDLDIRKIEHRLERHEHGHPVIEGHIRIAQSEIRGRTNFGSATFSGLVNFASAIFSTSADFRSTTFNKNACFTHATFGGDANFGSATFSGGAVFDSPTFHRGAYFGSATFCGDPYFAFSTFCGVADFHFATFRRGASFYSATFSKAADFHFATFRRGASFYSATFCEGANFANATMKQPASFERVHFHENTARVGLCNDVLHEIVRWVTKDKVKLGKWPVTDFSGFNTTTIMDGSSNPYLKRYIDDEQWIASWRKRGGKWRHFLFIVWELTSHCGRSIWLWAGWSVFFALLFALAYTPSPDWMPERWYTFWQEHGAEFEQMAEAYANEPMGFWSSFYFSIVTFTTLGFGDVATANTFARFLVTLEVVLGYVMLGGLISIFANKLARRA